MSYNTDTSGSTTPRGVYKSRRPVQVSSLLDDNENGTLSKQTSLENQIKAIIETYTSTPDNVTLQLLESRWHVFESEFVISVDPDTVSDNVLKSLALNFESELRTNVDKTWRVIAKHNVFASDPRFTSRRRNYPSVLSIIVPTRLPGAGCSWVCKRTTLVIFLMCFCLYALYIIHGSF